MRYNCKYTRKGVVAITNIAPQTVLIIRGNGKFSSSTSGNVSKSSNHYVSIRSINKSEKCVLINSKQRNQSQSTFAPVFNNDFTRLSALSKSFPQTIGVDSPYVSYESAINETVAANGGQVLTEANMDSSEMEAYVENDEMGFSPTMIRDSDNSFGPDTQRLKESITQILQGSSDNLNANDSDIITQGRNMQAQLREVAANLNITEQEAFDAMAEEKNIDENNDFIPADEYFEEPKNETMKESVFKRKPLIPRTPQFVNSRYGTENKSTDDSAPLSPGVRPIRYRKPVNKLTYDKFGKQDELNTETGEITSVNAYRKNRIEMRKKSASLNSKERKEE